MPLFLRTCLFASIFFYSIQCSFAAPVPLERQALAEGSDFSDTPGVSFAQTPDWVIAKSYDNDATIPEAQLQDGVYFLLSDFQFLGDKQQREQQYRHFAIKINNTKAVDEYSQLDLGFDPNYESLHIHQVTLYRDGQAIDKLVDAGHHLSRNSNASQLVDGELNLQLILSDVRVGDVLEYAYTVVGTNPVFAGHFYHRRPLQWNVPIDQQYVRVLWRRATPLNIKLANFPADEKVRETSIGQDKNYEISLSHTSGQTVARDTPDWYDPRPQVSFSDFKDWASVANWGWQLFASKIVVSKNVEQQAKKLSTGLATDEEKVTAALDFVQQKIRYLGLEMGVNSHLPSLPQQTLAHRFGDCKDKSVLLIALLKAMGIEASPVLVNTYTGEALNERLPSAKAFNHAIVRLTLADKTFYVDPTISFQKGNVLSRTKPYYGYALLLSPFSEGLEKMPQEHSGAAIDYQEVFDLAAGENKHATYTVNTLYAGTEAERMRDRLASDGSAQLKKSYVDYFSQQYGDVTGDPLIVNDSDKGVLITENYALKNPWTEDADKDHKFYISENQITSYVSVPDDMTPRPYALSYPLTIHGTITLKLFNTRHWDLSAEHHREKNQFFDYQFDVKFDALHQQLVLEYRYKSLVSSVAKRDFNLYVKALKRIDDWSSYGIVIYQSQKKQQQFLLEKFANRDVAIIGCYILIASVLIGFAAAFWLSQKPQQPHGIFYTAPWYQMVVLSVLTFGFYFFYWSYCNWRYLEQRDESKVSAIWSGILAPFSYALLALAIWRTYARQATQKQDRWYALMYLVVVSLISLLLVASVIGWVNVNITLWWITPTIAMIPLVWLIGVVNRLNNHNMKPQWKPYHWLLTIAVVPLYVVAIGKVIGILPQTTPIRGNELWPTYNAYLVEQKVIPTGESADYFYSPSFFDFRDQGVGFSNSTIFSYRRDNGKSILQQASFDNVTDIQVESLASSMKKTEVRVLKQDGSRIVIRLPSAANSTNQFIDALKQRWQQHRKTTEKE